MVITNYQGIVNSYKSKGLQQAGQEGPGEKAALWCAVHPRKIPAIEFLEYFYTRSLGAPPGLNFLVAALRACLITSFTSFGHSGRVTHASTGIGYSSSWIDAENTEVTVKLNNVKRIAWLCKFAGRLKRWRCRCRLSRKLQVSETRFHSNWGKPSCKNGKKAF